MSTDGLRKTNYENKSSKYIKEAKKKEAKRDQILALTLSKAKNEFEYDCLAKMGEANELSQILGESLTYRAYNSAVREKLALRILMLWLGWTFEMPYL